MPRFAAPSSFSDEFLARFGGTKVTDPAGLPIRVFRGDNKGSHLGNAFKVIETDEGGSGGIYFTDSPVVASNYANSKTWNPDGAWDIINHVTVTINGMKKPLRLADAWLKPKQRAAFE
jgi:hypothetical protein